MTELEAAKEAMRRIGMSPSCIEAAIQSADLNIPAGSHLVRKEIPAGMEEEFIKEWIAEFGQMVSNPWKIVFALEEVRQYVEKQRRNN